MAGDDLPTLTDLSGAALRVGRMIAEGGEALLYPLIGPTETRPRLVKLYHHVAAERLTRLAALLEAPAPDPCALPGHRALVWPEGIARAVPDGSIVGVILPHLVGARPASIAIAPTLRRRHWPGATWRHMISLATTVAGLVAHLHDRGYVLGDLKPDNILVDPAFRPSLIDCDGWGPPGLAPTGALATGTDGYTAPEFQTEAGWRHPRTQAADRFGLAVTVAELLLGRRPGPDWLQGWPPVEILGPEIPALLRDGLSAEPSIRPSAALWRVALTELLAELTRCAARPWHVHRADTACPWCAIEARVGVALFPEPPRATTGMTDGLTLALDRALILGDTETVRTLRRLISAAAA